MPDAARVALAGALLLAAAGARAQAALPGGFATISLGDPWSAVERAGTVVELTRPTSAWERHVHDCGYRSARVTVDGTRLLATAQDAVVTELSYATPIAPDSDLVRAAEQVVETYGPPRAVTMRDALGAIAIDPERASYVLLEYDGPVTASFALSGAPLWEYRISITDRDARRLENKTMRCARERAAASRGGS